ncbi:MAG: hypothetical protein HYX43_18875 [Burkholderiales bacterium]|nr:hypothetical protein [Burkholderiales bacterium]
MLTLELEVPKDRASLALATLRDGNKILMSDFAAASATPSISAEHGNPSCDPTLPWGHPPLGTYRLVGVARNTGAPHAEYGGDQFLFYSTAGSTPGDADAARLFGLHGRRGLLAYAGALGDDNYLRRTQGGVRLPEKMATAVCEQLCLQRSMKLTLRPLEPRMWWAFWRRDVTPPPLSATEPPAIQAPDDEMTLLEALLNRFIGKPDRATSTSDTHESQSERSSSSSSSDGASSSSSLVAAGVAAGAAAALVTGAALGSEAVYTAYASPLSDSSGGSDGGWSGGDSDSSSSDGGSDSGGSDSGGGGGDGGGGGGGG